MGYNVLQLTISKIVQYIFKNYDCNYGGMGGGLQPTRSPLIYTNAVLDENLEKYKQLPERYKIMMDIDKLVFI